MAHIGVLIPGALGHLNPASCLGRELQARDHTVTVFQVLDLEDTVGRTGLEYQAIGEEQFPSGRYNDYIAHLGTLKGLATLRYTIWFFAFRSRILFAQGLDLPPVLRQMVKTQNSSNGELSQWDCLAGSSRKSSS